MISKLVVTCISLTKKIVTETKRMFVSKQYEKEKKGKEHFLFVCSHELDVEESPQLTPEEAWSKLGLKHKPDPV